MVCVCVFLCFLCVYLIFSKRLSDYGCAAIEEGVAVINKKYKVVFFNPSFLRVLGLAKSHQGKFTSWDAPKKEIYEQCLYLLGRLEADNHDLCETVFFKEGGESLATFIRAKSLSFGKRLLILQDLDKEKREFKLGKEFIANASHELRTPIAIIKGFVETIKDLPEVSEAMLEDIFEKILKNCGRMDDIVKNLLVLTDLDHLFSLKKKSCDVASLLDNACYLLKERHPEAEIKLEINPVENVIEVDLPLIELAILNLLENAVKYSREKAKLLIEYRQDSKEHKISIKDSGIGIPKENIPYIFDRFYAVNKPLSRKLGGAGLGLSIVKTIIDKHQGSIAVESTIEEGTTFTICLPK